jgi:hypothetical protein
VAVLNGGTEALTTIRTGPGVAIVEVGPGTLTFGHRSLLLCYVTIQLLHKNRLQRVFGLALLTSVLLHHSLEVPIVPTPPTMPAHRNPSRSQSHAPYKPPVIVISSDEEEDPRPAPPRGLRKPRRSKRQEVLEVLDDTPVKHEEETETEKLRRQCHELEQVGSPCTV